MSDYHIMLTQDFSSLLTLHLDLFSYTLNTETIILSCKTCCACINHSLLSLLNLILMRQNNGLRKHTIGD